MNVSIRHAFVGTCQEDTAGNGILTMVPVLWKQDHRKRRFRSPLAESLEGLGTFRVPPRPFLGVALGLVTLSVAF